ncbi:GNAT family N-acetyltransferase [Acidiphilium iwatense]|uniref:GNAT family N-acetyltransferase n=1 Tax=Acidiphilium iwatense TaxID=768198 RepID=A0ABS9DUE1_9PROT|nr:GNAT family N-acetyltransferase [Acidiphilium iwatense]MCF3946351.1 GNAT family N-acetyltransferase [Acidiphilium iwatense]
MSLLIRPAAPDDHDALLSQFLGLNRYEHAISDDRRSDHQGALESLEGAWRNIAAKGGSALVVELDGRVVGHLFLLFEEDDVFIRDDVRSYGYISSLFIQEAMRGSGVGKALMVEAERIAAARGVHRLMLYVLAENPNAQRFYADAGFAPHGLEMMKPIADKT